MVVFNISAKILTRIIGFGTSRVLYVNCDFCVTRTEEYRSAEQFLKSFIDIPIVVPTALQGICSVEPTMQPCMRMGR